MCKQPAMHMRRTLRDTPRRDKHETAAGDSFQVEKEGSRRASWKR